MESQQQLFSQGLAGLGVVCCTIECVQLWKYHALGVSRERGSSVHILVLWLTHIVSVGKVMLSEVQLFACQFTVGAHELTGLMLPACSC